MKGNSLAETEEKAEVEGNPRDKNPWKAVLPVLQELLVLWHLSTSVHGCSPTTLDMAKGLSSADGPSIRELPPSWRKPRQ